jgi:hypothetical protein
MRISSLPVCVHASLWSERGPGQGKALIPARLALSGNQIAGLKGGFPDFSPEKRNMRLC